MFGYPAGGFGSSDFQRGSGVTVGDALSNAYVSSGWADPSLGAAEQNARYYYVLVGGEGGTYLIDIQNIAFYLYRSATGPARYTISGRCTGQLSGCTAGAQQDGRFTYSKTILLDFGGMGLHISPNPAHGMVNLIVNNMNEAFNVRIVDVNGRTGATTVAVEQLLVE